ncbi:MAG: helix-turn-helix transcriptional regulator [Hydrococcus sp. RM1_1_31]|nr:helix-turn-helix transcriptional regulator [Hydrococcus sp. RM1_1_31]
MQTNELLLELPYPPIISSQECAWNRIQIAHYRQPKFCIPEYISPHHGICLNAGKKVELKQQVDGKVEIVNSVPGEVGIYPAFLNQSFAWDREAEFILIYLEPALLNRLGEELYESDRIELIPQLYSRFDPLIQQIALALKTTLETDGVSSRLYAESMANALSVHLLARYSNLIQKIHPYRGKLSQQQLRQVIEYIDSHLNEDISLAELALVVQLSEYYFARLFKQTTGIAPHQYHLQCRIKQAKKLLLQGLAIADVAQAVGFASQGHLNYHFKRQVGITPKQFAQK